MDPDLVLENVKLDCQAARSSPEATTSLKHGKKLAKMMMSHASSFQLRSFSMRKEKQQHSKKSTRCG